MVVVALLPAIAVTMAILYIPGWFLARAFGFSRIVSLICAPLVGFGLYAALPVPYAMVGIECNAFTIGGAALILCLGCYIIQRIRLQGPPPTRTDVSNRQSVILLGGEIPFEWAALALYLVIGITVTCVMFVFQLSASDSILCRHDNQTHLNFVKSFLESGRWSSIHASSYLAAADNAIPFDKPYETYPSAWADVVALSCSITGQPVAVSANALNAVIAGLAFPSSAFLLVKSIFPRDRLAILGGAAVASAFSSFPWSFFVKGPLYPNFAAYSLMAAFLALVVLMGRRKDHGGMASNPIGYCALSALAIVAMALTHPNALFASVVFALPFATHVLWCNNRDRNRRRRTGIVKALWKIAVLWIVAGALWLTCFNAPVFSGIVGFGAESEPSLSFFKACARLANLNAGTGSAETSRPEYLLAILVISGVAACAVKRKLWVLVPAAYMATAFVIVRSTAVGPNSLLTGFWYNDHYRIIACYAIFVIPIAAYGLSSLCKLPTWLYRKARGDAGITLSQKRVSIALAALVSACLFVPSIALPNGSTIVFGLERQRQLMLASYGRDETAVYSQEERDFVDRALSVLPSGALVINNPSDGSCYSYAINDLNTYYRTNRLKNESETGKTIRTKLANYATDPSVQAAVQKTGARYLLILDREENPDRANYLSSYNRSTWKGIISVEDDTPGFTSVLAEGEMRLYLIG